MVTPEISIVWQFAGREGPRNSYTVQPEKPQPEGDNRAKRIKANRSFEDFETICGVHES
jgi:hypothetical protein